MKIQARVKIALLISTVIFTSGTICSAKALTKVQVKPSQVTTPELAQADERVRQSKVQLETARKQVDAAKALFRAAQADLRAAEADRRALALMTKAQSLADASGLQQPSQANSSIQTSSSIGKSSGNSQEGLNGARLQPVDFNAGAAQGEPLPLR